MFAQTFNELLLIIKELNDFEGEKCLRTATDFVISVRSQSFFLNEHEKAFNAK